MKEKMSIMKKEENKKKSKTKRKNT